MNVLKSRRQYQPIPSPGGESAEQASSVYQGFYGEMPVPATQYATSVTALQSLDTPPSVRTVMSNSSIVDRSNRIDGMRPAGGHQAYRDITPQVLKTVDSSKFQKWLIGPYVNYEQNIDWYIAYPAASVMLGGMHNLALSQRIQQIPTRATGGPGPAFMRPAPRFKAVQVVPRYSTMPPTYQTTSGPG